MQKYYIYKIIQSYYKKNQWNQQGTKISPIDISTFFFLVIALRILL